MWLRRGPDPFGNVSVHLLDLDERESGDTFCGVNVPLKDTGGWEGEYQGDQADITCRDCLDELLAMIDDVSDDS